ncbi:alpha/beta fold hydrolase [soil metagenome]
MIGRGAGGAGARRIARLAAGVTLILGCAGNSSPRSGDEPSTLALAECALPDLDDRALCGKLQVYEDRDAGAGRRIPLRVAVLPATGPESRRDPIFVLVGGPGQGAVESAASYAELLAPLRVERDLVFVDQRGTGGSNPLQCDLYSGQPSGPLGDFFPPDAVRACRAALEREAELRLSPSALAAEDLDDVRAALGYDRIHLEAASYGTRVALLYLRSHSARVRAAFLRSVSPPWMRQPLSFAEDAQAALDSLTAACRLDPTCQEAFPRFEEELESVLERVGSGGVTVDLGGERAPPRTVVWTRGAFAEKVRFLLYAPGLSMFLPVLIHHAAEGDFVPFTEIAWDLGEQVAHVGTTGMYLSVTCTEDVARITPEEAANGWPGTFLGDYRVRQQMAACALWPVGTLPPDFDAPIESDVPVLLVSSTIDPITPPRWAEEAARGLRNSRRLLVPNVGHSPATDCVMAIAREFLATASHKGLDIACLGEARRPPFALELPD